METQESFEKLISQKDQRIQELEDIGDRYFNQNNNLTNQCEELITEIDELKKQLHTSKAGDSKTVQNLKENIEKQKN